MQNKKEKIALFDFCDTLVSFQTANEYVRFYIKHHASFAVKLRHICYLLMSITGLVSRMENRAPDKNIRKRMLLWQLKGCPIKRMEQAAMEYYQQRIKPCLIIETIHELTRLQKEGWRILIVSGGYDLYINHFALEFGISENDVISNHLVFINGIFSGRYDVDCMGSKKVEILNDKFNRKNYDVIAYSDSESDLPMLLWADTAIVISKSWAKNYNFQEIRIPTL